ARVLLLNYLVHESYNNACLVFALLANLCLLAAKVAQVVELCATNVTTGDDLNAVKHRAVYREGTLDANLEADLANGEGFANACTGAANNHALEDLNTRTGTLGDVYVHLYGVTGEKLWDVATQRSCIYNVEDLHDLLFLYPPQVGHM